MKLICLLIVLLEELKMVSYMISWFWSSLGLDRFGSSTGLGLVLVTGQVWASFGSGLGWFLSGRMSDGTRTGCILNGSNKRFQGLCFGQ